jgi:hypothetical protein
MPEKIKPLVKSKLVARLVNGENGITPVPLSKLRKWSFARLTRHLKANPNAFPLKRQPTTRKP